MENARGGGGLFERLQDEQISYKDKVKLVSYAWQTATFILPNKEQILLDWLCSSIIANAKIINEDTKPLWQCFSNVLSCKRTHSLTKFGKSLLIKAELFKIIVELINHHQKYDSEYVETVLSCCHKILASPLLSTVFTTQYVHMVHLVSAVVEMYVSRLTEGASISEDQRAALTVIIDRFVSTQNQEIIAQKVAQNALNKLVIPCIMLMFRVSDGQGHVTSEWSDIVTAIDTVINNAIFQKDFMNHFIYFIKLKSNDTITDSSPPKIPLQFFQLLTDILQKKGSSDIEKKAICFYLPKVIHGFHHHLKIKDDFTLFNTFVYLLEIINIKIRSAEESCDPHISHKSWLNIVQTLLQICLELDFYNVAWDSVNGEKQLKCLQNLTTYLLNHKCHRSRDGIGCMEALLQLNHLALQPQIPSVLHRCCHCNSKQKDEEYNKMQELFIRKLAETYQKLRQIPKLLKLTFESIKLYSSDAAPWAPVYLKKLAECFTSLSQGVVVELWRLFVAEISGLISDDAADIQKVSLMSPLFCHFLLNIHLADYSMTSHTLTQVKDLMKETREKILLPLLNSQTLGASSCVSFLHSWGEVHMLLHQYSKHSETNQSDFVLTSALTAQDLSFVHLMVPLKMAKKIFKRLHKDKENAQVQFFMDLLLIQKVRALLLFGNKEDSAYRTSLQNVAQYFVEKVNTYSAELNENTWDKQPEGVTEDNYSVAHWHLFLQNLPLLADFCTSDDLYTVVNHLVRSVSLSDEQVNVMGDMVSMGMVSSQFLSSPAFYELRQLQTCFVTSFFSNLHTVTPTSAQAEDSSPKKKKKRKRQQCPWNLIETLACTDTNWSSDVNVLYREYSDGENSSWKILKDVGVDMTNLLRSGHESATLTSHQILRISRLVKVLEKTQLEFLMPGNHARCMLGIVALLLSLDSECEAVVELVTAVSDCVRILLDGAHGSALFSLVNSGQLISWMVSFASTLPLHVKRKMQDLNLAMIQAAMWSPAALEDLQITVTKEAERLSAVITKWKDRSNREPDVEFVLTILRCLSKVLQKGNIKEAVKSKCLAYFSELSVLFTLLTRTVITEYGHSSNQDLSLVSCLVDGFGCILEVECRKNKDDLERISEDIVQLIKPACEICLKMSASDQEQIVQKRALFFIKAISKFHEFTKQHYPECFVQEVWSCLMKMLGGCGSVSDLEKNFRQEVDSSTSKAEVNEEIDEEIETDGPQEGSTAYHVNLTTEIPITMKAVIRNCDEEEFKKLLNFMLSSMSHPSELSDVKSALLTWQQLAAADLSEEQYGVFSHASQDLISRLQFVLQQDYFRKTSHLTGVVIPALETQAKLLTHGPNLLSPQTALTCLHSLFHCALEQLDTPEGAAVFSACYEILNNLLIHHTQAVYRIIPSFIAGAKLLMKAVIQEGHQETAGQGQGAVSAAYLVTRLFTLIETHKEDFSKVALYLVADFVTLSQKVTLLSEVKKALLPGIYSLLDLCDHYSTAVLHTVLTHGVKEIYLNLHADYNKYHKYKGRI